MSKIKDRVDKYKNDSNKGWHYYIPWAVGACFILVIILLAIFVFGK